MSTYIVVVDLPFTKRRFYSNGLGGFTLDQKKAYRFTDGYRFGIKHAVTPEEHIDALGGTIFGGKLKKVKLVPKGQHGQKNK